MEQSTLLCPECLNTLCTCYTVFYNTVNNYHVNILKHLIPKFNYVDDKFLESLIKLSSILVKLNEYVNIPGSCNSKISSLDGLHYLCREHNVTYAQIVNDYQRNINLFGDQFIDLFNHEPQEKQINYYIPANHNKNKYPVFDPFNLTYITLKKEVNKLCIVDSSKSENSDIDTVNGFIKIITIIQQIYSIIVYHDDTESLDKLVQELQKISQDPLYQKINKYVIELNKNIGHYVGKK